VFQKGDQVVIKPEWRDNPAIDWIYEISAWNLDRGFMFPANWRELGFSIRPIELIRQEMIEKAPASRTTPAVK